MAQTRGQGPPAVSVRGDDLNRLVRQPGRGAALAHTQQMAAEKLENLDHLTCSNPETLAPRGVHEKSRDSLARNPSSSTQSHGRRASDPHMCMRDNFHQLFRKVDGNGDFACEEGVSCKGQAGRQRKQSLELPVFTHTEGRPYFGEKGSAQGHA
jgi:hypothetical protein